MFIYFHVLFQTIRMKTNAKENRYGYILLVCISNLPLQYSNLLIYIIIAICK